MTALTALKEHLEAGKVYRRADLAPWSNAVDRHLKQLVADGTLKKLAGGLYLCPRPTSFGAAPADDHALVRAFLKDERFLITSPNNYNALGLGTTQLYNERVVYNHKRHGQFTLGNRPFRFAVKPHFPETATPAFLLVDVVNNLDQLAEDRDAVLQGVKARAREMEPRTLLDAVKTYGGARAKKLFAGIFPQATLNYA